MGISSDDKKIEEFLTRGVENIYPSRDFVKALLKSGKRLTVYLGVDPTGPTLHLGHAILLKKLKEFRDLGHRAIFLIGDFTAMIGDPTDKLSLRKQLPHKEVLKNARLYKKQSSSFLRFIGRNKVRVVYNSKWYNSMNMEDVLALSSYMTVDQMLKRDMFARRIKEEKPIYLHEFLYPLMQGYDSVVMDTDGEVGGNDQTFNMLAGRTLMKQLKNKEKFVISMKLLTDKEGKKMGKTEGNMVALSDSSDEMYGKIMSWTDDMIIPALELCTYMPMENILAISEDMKKGTVNPRDAKMRLAKEIVSIYYGEDESSDAEESFVRAFQKKETPEEMKEVYASRGAFLSAVLIDGDVVRSKADFRRLVKDGAIKTEKGEKIYDERFTIERDRVFKVGKRRFVKVVVG